DALAEHGRAELARQKYSEAQTELDRVQKAYPGWNEQVVQFRLNYAMEKLGSAKMAEKPIPEPGEQTAPASVEPADRIKLLLEQDAMQRQLQTFTDCTDVKVLRGENESLKGRVTKLQIKADELKQRLSGVQAGLASLQARNGDLVSARKIADTDSNDDNKSSG